MIKKIKKLYSLIDEGAKGVLIGILTTALHNISILCPTVLLFVVSALLSHYRHDNPQCAKYLLLLGNCHNSRRNNLSGIQA